MDTQTILTAVVTSLLSSSLITAGIVFFVKKSLDRLIDLRYEKILEETKTQIQEAARRKSALFDRQAQAYQSCIAHIHRLRRLARSIQEMTAQEIKGPKRKEFDGRIDEFKQAYSNFEDFISENRVLLNLKYAQTQHEFRNVFASITGYHSLITRLGDNHDQVEHLVSTLKSSISRLDEQYLTLLEDAQTFLGGAAD